MHATILRTPGAFPAERWPLEAALISASLGHNIDHANQGMLDAKLRLSDHRQAIRRPLLAPIVLAPLPLATCERHLCELTRHLDLLVAAKNAASTNPQAPSLAVLL